MATPGAPVHGGDIAWAEARFGKPAEGWLDLSTGINPFPYPVGELPAACWERLPGSDLSLRAAAAENYGAPDPDCVIAAPGSQAIIQLLPELFPAGDVAVLGPTYGEHLQSWRRAGRRVTVRPGWREAQDAAIIVLANPNNPDGRRVEPELLWDLSRRQNLRGGALIVDEAFADCCPELSVASRAGVPGLLILRSFGKFFGLAGLRLGFALGSPDLLARIRERLGPWPVSGPALAIGERALRDEKWIAETRTRLAAQAAALDTALHSAGLTILGGTLLFRLVTSRSAAVLHDHLGRHGILIRSFSWEPNWLRFGLPGRGASRLEMALRTFAN